MTKFDAKLYKRSKTTEELVQKAKEMEKAFVKKARTGHLPGFLLIPVNIKLRLNGVSGPALQVFCCLLDLELKYRKWRQTGEFLSLSNEAAKKWGLSRGQKLRGLKELAEREILAFTQHGKACPEVLIFPHLMV